MTAVFVHLSDIHFGQEKEGGQRALNQDARDRLLEDARAVVSGLSINKASGIIVTGDIAYSGKEAEYQEAGKWFDQLAQQVGCLKSEIQLVPGNHDIDRNMISPGIELMLADIHAGNDKTLDRYLDNAIDRESLYLRFEEYRKFAEAYQCPLNCTGDLSAEHCVELVPGRHIRFVRLNSWSVPMSVDTRLSTEC